MCDVVISLARLGVDLLPINIMIPYSMGDVKSFFTQHEIWCTINTTVLLPKILESEGNKRYVTYNAILMHYESTRLGYLAYREVL